MPCWYRHPVVNTITNLPLNSFKIRAMLVSAPRCEPCSHPVHVLFTPACILLINANKTCRGGFHIRPPPYPPIFISARFHIRADIESAPTYEHRLYAYGWILNPPLRKNIGLRIRADIESAPTYEHRPYAYGRIWNPPLRMNIGYTHTGGY